MLTSHLTKGAILFGLLTMYPVCSTAAVTTPMAQTDIQGLRTLYGHVLDKQTGEYLIGAIIRVGNLATTTDATGHYRLDGVSSSNLTIEVSYMGYDTDRRKVTASADGVVEVNFELHRNDLQLGNVVVSANRSETLRRKAPVIVGVVTNKTLEQTSSVNLMQGLNFQTGVRTENNCQNCGLSQVRINGLEGAYSQILINSRPIFSALTGVYGLEMLSSAMIDRVEVVRGGGSALYGGSAIAGTINVITKDPTYNAATFGHTIGVHTGSTAFQNTTHLNASIVSSNRKAGLSIAGQHHERKPYDHNGDGFSEKAKMSDQAFGVRGFLRPSPQHRFGIDYNNFYSYRRGGDQVHLPAHKAEIAEQAEYKINMASADYNYRSLNGEHLVNVYLSGANSDRSTFYGDKSVPDAYGRSHNLILVTGAQYTWNAPRLGFAPSQLVVGSEYKYDYLTDGALTNSRPIAQRINNLGLYAQNEWRTQYLDLLLGARLDKHRYINKAIFSPRLNIKFKPSEALSIRATYASGFRAPQTFDEDLHVETVQGTQKLVINDPNLKEERSHSVMLSADWYTKLNEDWQANFVLEGFYTRLNGAFSLETSDTINALGFYESTRVNAENANVLGVMAEAKLSYRTLFNMQLGFTLQQAKYKNNQEVLTGIFDKHFMRTPDHYGYLTAAYTPSKTWNFSLNATYTGPMHILYEGDQREQKVYRTRTFLDLGLKAAYHFQLAGAINTEVSLAVKNLFNAYQNDFDKALPDENGVYGRTTSWMYGPNESRTLLLGVKFSL